MSLPDSIIKYPRTQHIEGSRLQAGNEDLDRVPFTELGGCQLVVEEKVDGANCALSFREGGKLLLQSRGHYLSGGARERHFNLFKQWSAIHQQTFREVLGSRYVMYGEWLYAKHTVFYNDLAHYFMEFDLLDKKTGEFLDTPSRYALVGDLPVVSVPVIHHGIVESRAALTALVGPSAFIRADHLAALRVLCEEAELDAERVLQETDPSPLMEGLYIKLETGGIVQRRFKWVRACYLARVTNSESHWLDRPIIPNQLRDGVDLFEA